MQIFALEMANRGVFPLFRGQIALSEPMTEADIDKFIGLSKDIVEGIAGSSEKGRSPATGAPR